MLTTYVKRFRMEFDLTRTPVRKGELPSRYRLLPWEPELLDQHATAKYDSFAHEMDSTVFPCLGDWNGCRRLVREISLRAGFLPQATWLIEHSPSRSAEPVPVGTIQGILSAPTLGAIQNVGVVPQHRGLGLGKALVMSCLAGFRQQGAQRVYLEVTARNTAAVQLYNSLGFRSIRTMYLPLDRVDEFASANA